MFETNRNGVPIPMRHAPIALAAALMLLALPGCGASFGPSFNMSSRPSAPGDSLTIRRVMGRWVNRAHRRRPMIIPVVIEA